MPILGRIVLFVFVKGIGPEGMRKKEAGEGRGQGGREGWGGVGGAAEKRGLALGKCGSGQWASPWESGGKGRKSRRFGVSEQEGA